MITASCLMIHLHTPSASAAIDLCASHPVNPNLWETLSNYRSCPLHSAESAPPSRNKLNLEIASEQAETWSRGWHSLTFAGGFFAARLSNRPILLYNSADSNLCVFSADVCPSSPSVIRNKYSFLRCRLLFSPDDNQARGKEAGFFSLSVGPRLFPSPLLHR